MGYETWPPLHKSASVWVVAAVATLLDLVSVRLMHIEPVGLRGFGLLCVSCSTLLSYLARQGEAPRSASISQYNANHSANQRPVALRDENLLSLLPQHRFATVREGWQVLLAGRGILPHETIFQPSKQAIQVAA